jgi:hypothetical protein
LGIMNSMRTARWILLLLVLIVPSFALLIRPGIHTMHDFHIFRQYEFDKCFREGSIPCRWSPDSAKGYGEPVFNYYGQLPYWLGEIFRVLGFSVIDSVKAVFILSIIAGAVFIFVLGRSYWGNSGGFISALFYTFAPYRAVDIWVRGALPEALAFAFFPAIILALNAYLKTRHLVSLLTFSLLLALLIITHNLSAFMFLPFLAAWWLFLSPRESRFRSLPALLLAGIFSLCLSAFYLLPVAREASLVTLSKTTSSYYNFQIHFATLRQLFLSREWKYGASVWGPIDDMSFSVGQVHWLASVVAVTAAALAILRKKQVKHILPLIVFAFLAGLSVLLTHGKSLFVWQAIPLLSFIQFPWRFLSPAAFFLALVAGSLSQFFPRKITVPLVGIITVAVILTNYSFFTPDIWRNISDKDQFSGPLWDEQRSSAIFDYWPVASSEVPENFAPSQPWFSYGDGSISIQKSGSHIFQASIHVSTPQADVIFPTVIFPGWQATVNGSDCPVLPYGPLNLISLNLPVGENTVSLKFTDTPVRKMGNIVSLISLGLLVVGMVFSLRKNVYFR